MTSAIAPALAAWSPVARLAVFMLSAGLICSHAPARAADVAFSDQESHAGDQAAPARPVRPQRYQPEREAPRIVEEIPAAPSQTRAAREGEDAIPLRLDLPAPAAVAEKMASKPSQGGPRKIGFNRLLADFLEPSQAASRSWPWRALASGERVTRVQVRSPGAAALRVGVRVKRMPASGELRFFSGQAAQSRAYRVEFKSVQHILDASRNAGARAGENPDVYWSPTLEGDQVIVEIRLASPADLDRLDLEIHAVSHLLLDPKQSSNLAPQAAASCNLDVNCYSTLNQKGEDISAAVARMVFTTVDGTGLCSGTLLADRAHSNIPFFLTARHCISTAAEASSLETAWFYESSECNSRTLAANVQYRSGGASLLESYSQNDMTLLRLNEQPPAGVIYAGWDWNAEGESYAGIHHPEGDLKKISFGAAQRGYRCDTGSGDQVICFPDAGGSYFRMLFDRGFTEQGSSGSGIFKDNAYLVGTLTAGSGVCNDSYGIYGRLKAGYDSGLNKWLENNKIGFLENPQPSSYQSGITVISGWTCIPGANQATPEVGQVMLEIDGKTLLRASYGTSREDTRSDCGDINNGFGLLVNMNSFGPGAHSVRALADGQEIGRASFTVTTLGSDYLRGASGTYRIPDFPATGQNVLISWQENLQNFVISARNVSADTRSGQTPIAAPPGTGSVARPSAENAATLAASPAAAGLRGYLENPQPKSYLSGITVLSGWACQPAAIKRVSVEIDGLPVPASYGTERPDTSAICAGTDNGWGVLFNTNSLGDGLHTARALVDGVELGRADFTVTTLGGDYLRGLSKTYRLADFPKGGDSVVVIWQENLQNFTIKEADVH
ncbi:MAG: hypothetical protein JNM60_04685 [Candidatus Competibacteraceae bacterium]|nr:hypothetical protein [Candidatus Competibacteraceae bacterium]